MKHTKSILMAAVAALSIASASANEVIYITGATAFRSAANGTLFALYTNNLLAVSEPEATATASIALYFTNCVLTNGNTVDLAVTWTGSEGGMQSVASGTNNVTVPFYDKAKLASQGIIAKTFGVTTPNTATMAEDARTSLQKGIIGCSDSFQASSRFQGGKKSSDGRTYNALTLTEVGIVPYSLIASKGYATTFPDRNMTLNNMWQILTATIGTSGQLISGKTNDAQVKLFAVGRNIDSGTRVITLANMKAALTDKVTQYRVTATNGGITAMTKYPQTTINGIVVGVGESGESSGGTVAGWMTNTIPNSISLLGKGTSTNYLAGYVSVADITSARRTAGLVTLKMNGVEGRCYDNATFTTLDAGYTNVITGAYPLWGYEFISYDPAVASDNTKALANNLITTIRSYPSTSSVIAPNIALGDMRVSRTSDGGNQTPK